MRTQLAWVSDQANFDLPKAPEMWIYNAADGNQNLWLCGLCSFIDKQMSEEWITVRSYFAKIQAKIIALGQQKCSKALLFIPDGMVVYICAE
jgi:hypothetical protein